MKEPDCHRAACGPIVTRRRFLIDSAGRAAAAGLAASTAGSIARGADGAPKTSRVVIVTHPKALIKPHQADSGVVDQMVEVGMKALTGKTSMKDAWQMIAQPGQRVTMKWNEMGWRPIQTHPEVRNVIAGALARDGGLDPAKVFQFSRIECKGDAARILKVLLPTRNKHAKLRRLFPDFTDCLINVPVLKVHSGKGICISMKNHFGSIANPSTFHDWSRGQMGKSIVELNLHPSIRDKTRLIIVDALRPQWDHGPLHVPRCRWNLNALIFGFDTVAVDAVGLDALEKKRKTQPRLRRKWQLPHARNMLAYAQEKGLGVADPSRIEIERIELKA